MIDFPSVLLGAAIGIAIMRWGVILQAGRGDLDRCDYCKYGKKKE